VAIRVVVVDDEPMVCAHLRTILGSADELEVVGEPTPRSSGSTSAPTHRWWSR
jgi:DNA-binding NarL/FixJ family response regulator